MASERDWVIKSSDKRIRITSLTFMFDISLSKLDHAAACSCMAWPQVFLYSKTSVAAALMRFFKLVIQSLGEDGKR